ncbi:rhamnulokinase [Clostridium sp. E02]|uniref:rhamnulokinase n=1 Tax=Clostridium sp. E02 TaxID=2487134 RepID=UPI000F52700A|nr:rhamnulokinase [Clostridium sp. E02]
MERYYLAVDIGASSGRHILGTVKDHKIVLEEIYRFENGLKRKNKQICWDVESLCREIKEGMKQCKKLGKIPVSMGIDTWAVDFVLLDEKEQILLDAVGYRDERTKGMDEKVYEIISQEALYERTGIQKQIFNTIYQLMAVKESNLDSLKRADSLLMIPDYFNYRLTGVKKQEYTNATTTQLVSPQTGDWDYELIKALGFPEKLFKPLSMPGTLVGGLSEEIQEEVGFNCKVILPATHDTASAVMAIPFYSKQEDLKDNPLYISSGTWSLLGTERPKADCSLKSRKANFTNEGGYEHRVRYLKNIMGLWMIQSVKAEFHKNGADYSFSQLCEMASMETIPSLVDCNHSMFLAPESMILAIQDYCKIENQEIPQTAGEIAAVIYNSLAVCYKEAVEELESITGETYPVIHVVGGGSHASYLNQLTAEFTKKTVYAGPGEATAIGNLLAQMIEAGEYDGLKAAREAVLHSFAIMKYVPITQIQGGEFNDPKIV